MTKLQCERHTQRILNAKTDQEANLAQREATLSLLECSEHTGERTKKTQEDVAEILSILKANQAFAEGEKRGREETAAGMSTAFKVAAALGLFGGGSGVTLALKAFLGG